jgi:type II secretory pathway pseudopilin PulG
MGLEEKIGEPYTLSHCRVDDRGDDSGDTLVEVLITLLVLSLTVVSLLLAFSTSISASGEHRNIAVSDTVLRTVSESVVSQIERPSTTVPLATCTSTPQDPLTYYQNRLSIVVPSPWSSKYSAIISAVSFWNGSSFSPSLASCTTGYPQQLTIQVSGPGGFSESEYPVVAGSTQIYSSLLSRTITVAASPLSPVLPQTSALTYSVSGGGGTPTFSVDNGVNGKTSSSACSITNTTLSATGPGTCFVYVIITADPTYAAAVSSDVTVTFSSSATTTTAVAQSAPNITFPSPTTPYTAGHNAGLQTLHIVGTGFVNGATVTATAGGAFTISSTTFVSSTKINVTLTGSGGANQTSSLTLTNPDGGSDIVVNGLVNGGLYNG